MVATNNYIGTHFFSMYAQHFWGFKLWWKSTENLDECLAMSKIADLKKMLVEVTQKCNLKT